MTVDTSARQQHVRVNGVCSGKALAPNRRQPQQAIVNRTPLVQHSAVATELRREYRLYHPWCVQGTSVVDRK